MFNLKTTEKCIVERHIWSGYFSFHVQHHAHAGGVCLFVQLGNWSVDPATAWWYYWYLSLRFDEFASLSAGEKWTELRTGCHMDDLKLGIFSFTFFFFGRRKLVGSVFHVDDLILILLTHRAHMLNEQWQTKWKGCIYMTPE